MEKMIAYRIALIPEFAKEMVHCLLLYYCGREKFLVEENLSQISHPPGAERQIST